MLGSVRRTSRPYRGSPASARNAQNAPISSCCNHCYSNKCCMPGNQYVVTSLAADCTWGFRVRNGHGHASCCRGIIISPISGVVFDKFGPRAISIFGLALMTASLFLLSLSTVATPIAVVALFCMLQAAGQALANMPVNTWGVNALKNDMIAHGNAIANTGRQVAGGLCTALIITVMTSVTSTVGVDASLQVATAVGASVAYKVCAAIGLVSLIYAVFSIRPSKQTLSNPKEA